VSTARFELLRLYERVAAFAGMYLIAGIGVLGIGLPLWRRMGKQIELARTRLERLAHHDPTTGQLNRNAFNRDLAIALTGFVLLVAWRAPPLIAVLVSAGAGIALALV